MVSKYFTVLLVNKTNPCHALKNSIAVKGLNKMHNYLLCEHTVVWEKFNGGDFH